MTHVGACELISIATDPHSFQRWDSNPQPPPILQGSQAARDSYQRDLTDARAKSGLDESVIGGEALIGGRRVALAVSEFDFLAGSIGVSAAERLVSTIERATAERLPLIVAPASGGTRMQEGSAAFVQMATIAAAVAAHKAAGLPYLVYLRHPTTGGVLASFGSLGHITLAAPHSLIGFVGPRVHLALSGSALPRYVQTAENYAAHGLVDALVVPAELRAALINILDVLAARNTAVITAADAVHDVPSEHLAWDSVLRSRRADRPGLHDLLEVAANTVTHLKDVIGAGSEPSIRVALARFGTAPCVVVGHDRRYPAQPVGPNGLRYARRGMALAAELGLPLVTVIDTPGAALSQAAEEGGLAREIARCLVEMTTLKTGTLSVLLGQGAGGAALALLPADRVLCAQHAWLAPLPPEGASAIRHAEIDHAAEMAAAQGIRSTDLHRHGIVDLIVAERPDAAEEPQPFLRRLARAIEQELGGLRGRPSADLVHARAAKFRGPHATGLP
jgi:acyl-CoA carboxylase subunit beta